MKEEASEGEAIAARGGRTGLGDEEGLINFGEAGSCLEEKDCSKGFGSLSKSERVGLC